MATDYVSREDTIAAVKHAWAKGLEPTQYIEIIPAADVRLVTWISVETPPEEYGYYLVSIDDGGYESFTTTKKYDTHAKRWIDPFHQNITHWAPMPKPFCADMRGGVDDART